MVMNAKSLVGYCGLYCGACGIYQRRIKQAVENLKQIIGAYGFDKMMPELAKWEPSLQHYERFEKVMDGLIKLFGECPSCGNGGGNPNCIVRECCKQKGYTLCVECSDMEDCGKLQQYGSVKKELQRIKITGFDKWLEEMQRKVVAGYCYLDEKR